MKPFGSTEYDEIKMEDQVEDIKDNVKNIRDKVKNIDVDGIKHKVKHMYHDTKEKITSSEHYHNAKEKMNDAQAQLCENVRSKPLQSLGIAAGVGLILGLLIGRNN